MKVGKLELILGMGIGFVLKEAISPMSFSVTPEKIQVEFTRPRLATAQVAEKIQPNILIHPYHVKSFNWDLYEDGSVETIRIYENTLNNNDPIFFAEVQYGTRKPIRVNIGDELPKYTSTIALIIEAELKKIT